MEVSGQLNAPILQKKENQQIFLLHLSEEPNCPLLNEPQEFANPPLIAQSV
jgi:hypothetical protein